MDWGAFSDRYPLLAKQIAELSSHLYEIGAEEARHAPELDALVELLRHAPFEARTKLSISDGPIDRVAAHILAINIGSSNLLDFVRSVG
jgi:hypothetical protein